jgi:hypothetical protein
VAKKKKVYHPTQGASLYDVGLNKERTQPKGVAARSEGVRAKTLDVQARRDPIDWAYSLMG